MIFWVFMIFDLIVLSIFFIYPFFGMIRNQITRQAGIEATESEIEKPKFIVPTVRPHFQDPLILEKSFDLDKNGRPENFKVYSSLGKNIGDENTKIFLNNSENPVLGLIGYFDGIQRHTMNPRGEQILEMRTISGHTISTTFYAYKEGKLKIVPVSDAHPPTYYGIETRNRPDLKDIDGDGILELLVYYRHFPPEKKRTVTLYKFNGEAFIETKSYEEATSEVYL